MSSKSLLITDHLKIHTDSSKHIRQAPRRHLLVKRDKHGVAERRYWAPASCSASSVIWITKKDDIVSFCVDYRCFNPCTVVDAYPIPRIDEYLGALDILWFLGALENARLWLCVIFECCVLVGSNVQIISTREPAAPFRV